MNRFLLSFLLIMVAAPASAQEVESRDGDLDARLGKAPLQEEKSETPPDLAFGAYQRGMYLTAFNLALPRAEQGDAAAQTLIAELYDQGKGVGRDTKKAAQWYEVAAKSGNREAQFSYAMKLLQGVDVARDKDAAIELMREAADAGHPLAMFNYANHIIDQRPTTAGYRRALPYLEKAAEYRLSDAYYALSQIYKEGLATGIGDPEKGREWLIRSARAGIDTAQVELGVALMNGFDGPRDEKAAFEWFSIAARGGNVIAQNRLAHMFFTGTGTEKAPVEGGKWHILASRAGRADPVLDRYLGYLDEDGRKRALVAANRWPF